MAGEHKKAKTAKETDAIDKGVIAKIKQKHDKMKKRAAKDKAYAKRLNWAWAILLTVGVGVVFFISETLTVLMARWIIDIFDINIGNGTTAQTVCMVFAYAIAFSLLLLISHAITKKKVTRDELGLRGLPTWTDILLAPIGYILSFIAALAIMMVVQAAMPSFDWNQAQDVGFNNVISGVDRIVAFIALVVLAPIMEELIFRSFLYGKLRSRFSALPAIILTSILFGAMHGQWNVGIIVGIMSVFMCIARELTGTVYAGILMHMIRNGLAFYTLYVLGGGMGSAGATGVVIPLLLPFLV